MRRFQPALLSTPQIVRDAGGELDLGFADLACTRGGFRFSPSGTNAAAAQLDGREGPPRPQAISLSFAASTAAPAARSSKATFIHPAQPTSPQQIRK
jgi:hypothetical protein